VFLANYKLFKALIRHMVCFFRANKELSRGEEMQSFYQLLMIMMGEIQGMELKKKTASHNIPFIAQIQCVTLPSITSHLVSK
jgi:hypothetical protein